MSGALGIKEDGGRAPRCPWEKPLKEDCFIVTVISSGHREALFVSVFRFMAFSTASHPSSAFSECSLNAERETHRHSAVQESRGREHEVDKEGAASERELATGILCLSR